MLTEKQKANINRLDAQTCIDIMHECAERLGMVDVETYMYAMAVKRRTVYEHMSSKKVKSFRIGKHKFPCINSR